MAITYTFVKKGGAPSGTIRFNVGAQNFLIDDSSNTTLTTTDDGVAQELVKNPFLNLQGSSGGYTPPPVIQDVFVADGVISTGSRSNPTPVAGGGSVSDATSSAKGVVQLAGDFGGTAAAPTVPGLATKADSSALTSGLAGKANTTHTHAQSDITGLSTALTAKLDASQKGSASGVATLDGSTKIPTAQIPAVTSTMVDATVATAAALSTASTNDRARANHTGTQTSSTISDLTEAVQDIVGASVIAGAGATVTYDDTANTITIAATGTGGSTDQEIVRDTIAAALAGTGNITVTANDALDTITISTTATVNSTDATLLARANHTGTQAISTVSGLQTAIDAKQDASTAATDAELTAGLALKQDLTGKNAASGYAGLDSGSRIAQAQAAPATVVTLGTMSGTAAINCAGAQRVVAKGTFGTSDVVTTITNPVAGTVITLVLTKDATSTARNMTFSPTAKTPGGLGLDLTPIANAIDIISLVYDGATWNAFPAGGNML